MKTVMKVLLFPISLILSIFVAISGFLIERCTGLLNVVSRLLFLGAVLSLIQYMTGWPFGEARTTVGLVSTITVAMAAFLFSPYGLPTIAAWLIDKLDDLNGAIKSI